MKPADTLAPMTIALSSRSVTLAADDFASAAAVSPEPVAIAGATPFGDGSFASTRPARHAPAAAQTHQPLRNARCVMSDLRLLQGSPNFRTEFVENGPAD
jgi:hypothetical protein